MADQDGPEVHHSQLYVYDIRVNRLDDGTLELVLRGPATQDLCSGRQMRTVQTFHLEPFALAEWQVLAADNPGDPWTVKLGLTLLAARSDNQPISSVLEEVD